MTYIGISLYRNRKTANFPSNYANCPDYWQQDSDGNCIIPPASSKNTSLTYKFSTDSMFVQNASANTINFNTGTLCDKQKWANENSIIWDGVSSYSKCNK